MFNLYGNGGRLELLGTESGLGGSVAPTNVTFSYETTDEISFTANGASFNLVLGMEGTANHIRSKARRQASPEAAE